MTLLCKVIKWGWQAGWATKMRESWFSKHLTSTLCFSIWLSAPQLTGSVTLLMAGMLLQVQLPGPKTHHWAPPPIPPSNCLLGCYIPASENLYMEVLLSEPFPRTSSLHVLPSAMILAPLCFLTSPAGNGSCLATIILFSWWSAFISSPQLVSDPEAKRTQKGKYNAESLLGLLACLASAFVMWLDVSKIALKRIVSIVAAFPHPAVRAAQGICILIASQLKVLQCLMGFQMVMVPQAGISDRPTSEMRQWHYHQQHQGWKKAMDSPDPKRSCPFPIVTNYSWQFVTLLRVSSPPPHYLQG